MQKHNMIQFTRFRLKIIFVHKSEPYYNIFRCIYLDELVDPMKSLDIYDISH